MNAQTKTRDTTFTDTRTAMHAQTTTHATPFTDPRKSMYTETGHETPSRPSHIRSLRPVRAVEPDHADELRASQLFSVAAAEIQWFFTSTDTEGPALQARAIIEGWLNALDSSARRTLALRFDPTPWPERMQAEGLDSGYALVVSLVSTAPWHAESGPHQKLHRRASDQLEAAVRQRGISVMRGVSRRADWDFADAVRAYAKARGRVPSVLGRVIDAMAASNDNNAAPGNEGGSR
jgi:hypothetical protein